MQVCRDHRRRRGHALCDVSEMALLNNFLTFPNRPAPSDVITTEETFITLLGFAATVRPADAADAHVHPSRR
jgi:hypothetical protein